MKYINVLGTGSRVLEPENTSFSAVWQKRINRRAFEAKSAVHRIRVIFHEHYAMRGRPGRPDEKV